MELQFSSIYLYHIAQHVIVPLIRLGYRVLLLFGHIIQPHIGNTKLKIHLIVRNPSEGPEGSWGKGCAGCIPDLILP